LLLRREQWRLGGVAASACAENKQEHCMLPDASHALTPGPKSAVSPHPLLARCRAAAEAAAAPPGKADAKEGGSSDAHSDEEAGVVAADKLEAGEGAQKQAGATPTMMQTFRQSRMYGAMTYGMREDIHKVRKMLRRWRQCVAGSRDNRGQRHGAPTHCVPFCLASSAAPSLLPVQVVETDATIREIDNNSEAFDSKAETSFKYLQVRWAASEPGSEGGGNGRDAALHLAAGNGHAECFCS
jgi:hypothetical protein